VTERVLGIGGVFFRSQRPGELADWYEQHLGIERAPDFTGKVFKGEAGDATVWALFDADTKYFGPTPPAKELMVNYRVRDLDAMLEQLRVAGVEVDDHVEELEFGRFAWATDPEGNRFELWEPS
jgi:predicted enzyme related to lactoylglutathione lyase